MHIIPAIDIFDGQCVRLVEGNFSARTTYSSDPKAIAEQFLAAGAANLHVVDLEGAKNGAVANWDALEQILKLKNLNVQVGGGIRTEADIEKLLTAGAAYVVIGSIAIRSPEILETWITTFGAEKFCVALDIKDGELAYNGWQSTEKLQTATVVRRIAECGVSRILSTDIRRDGTLAGPNFGMYASFVQAFPSVQWLASGGVRSIDDIKALQLTGVAGSIIGKALYEGTITLPEAIGAVC